MSADFIFSELKRKIDRGDLDWTFDRKAFIDGYVTAALWADCMPPDDDPDGELGGRVHLEIRPEAHDRMAVDCHAFIDSNRDDLMAYCEVMGSWSGVDDRGAVEDEPAEARAGHDFWLTRRGHGVGFWDRGLGELGDRLTVAAESYSEPDYPYDCGDGTADV